MSIDSAATADLINNRHCPGLCTSPKCPHQGHVSEGDVLYTPETPGNRTFYRHVDCCQALAFRRLLDRCTGQNIEVQNVAGYDDNVAVALEARLLLLGFQHDAQGVWTPPLP